MAGTYRGMNTSELIAVALDRKRRVHPGMGKSKIAQACNSEIESTNPMDPTRDQIKAFLDENWDKIKSQITINCKNCYECSDVQVTACWLRSRSTIEREDEEMTAEEELREKLSKLSKFKIHRRLKEKGIKQEEYINLELDELIDFAVEKLLDDEDDDDRPKKKKKKAAKSTKKESKVEDDEDEDEDEDDDDENDEDEDDDEKPKKKKGKKAIKPEKKRGKKSNKVVDDDDENDDDDDDDDDDEDDEEKVKKTPVKRRTKKTTSKEDEAEPNSKLEDDVKSLVNSVALIRKNMSSIEKGTKSLNKDVADIRSICEATTTALLINKGLISKGFQKIWKYMEIKGWKKSAAKVENDVYTQLEEGDD